MHAKKDDFKNIVPGKIPWASQYREGKMTRASHPEGKVIPLSYLPCSHAQREPLGTEGLYSGKGTEDCLSYPWAQKLILVLTGHTQSASCTKIGEARL